MRFFACVPIYRLSLLFLAGWSMVAAASRPNIVVILTDDQAVDTIAAHDVWGARAAGIQTPNLDRLSAEGTTFRNAYNMGSWTGAVCVASRSMLQSGRNLWACRDAEKSGFREWKEAGKFWSQRMKAAGYSTWFCGKWHVGCDVTTLYDHTLRIRAGMPGTVPESYGRPVEGRPDTWSPWDTAKGGFWEGGKHWSEVMAEDAENLLARAAADDAPFFAILAFNAPHDPRQAPREFLDDYPLDSIPLPENFMARYPDYGKLGLGPEGPRSIRDEKLAPFPRTAFAIRTHRREYMAMVTHLDQQIGRVLGALEKTGRADQTHVFFTSDHGLAVGRHGLMGKQNPYEHSIRVPLIVRGAGFAKGAGVETPVYLQDIMATSLALGGADTSEVDFRDLRTSLPEQGVGSRPVYFAYESSQRAIRVGNDKLIWYAKGDTVRLYDLAADPQETRDRSTEAGREARIRELRALLAQEAARLGDPLAGRLAGLAGS